MPFDAANLVALTLCSINHFGLLVALRLAVPQTYRLPNIVFMSVRTIGC